MIDLASRCRPVAAPAPSVLVAQVGPDWDWASHGHRFSDVAGRLAPEGGARERLAGVLRALLENAVRHAAGGGARVSLCVDPVTGDFRVQTENAAAEGDWVRLRDRLALLAARSPAAAYRELLARATEQGDEAGLGLARLADEARVRIAARVHDGQVQVVAASRAPSFLPPAAIQGVQGDDTALYVSHTGDGTVRGSTWDGYTRDLAGSLLGVGAGAAPEQRLETTRTGAGVRATGRWPRCAA